MYSTGWEAVLFILNVLLLTRLMIFLYCKKEFTILTEINLYIAIYLLRYSDSGLFEGIRKELGYVRFVHLFPGFKNE